MLLLCPIQTMEQVFLAINVDDCTQPIATYFDLSVPVTSSERLGASPRLSVPSSNGPTFSTAASCGVRGSRGIRIPSSIYINTYSTLLGFTALDIYSIPYTGMYEHAHKPGLENTSMFIFFRLSIRLHRSICLTCNNKVDAESPFSLNEMLDKSSHKLQSNLHLTSIYFKCDTLLSCYMLSSPIKSNLIDMNVVKII